MKLFYCAPLLAAASAALFAQSDYLEPTARLPKGLAREDCRLTLFLDGSDTAIACRMTDFIGDAATFLCPLAPNARLALFVFELPGFKPFARNALIVRPAASSRILPIDLGELRPVPSDEPRIESILLRRGDGNVTRFLITLDNRAKKEVLVTGIRLSGVARASCGVGTGPPVYFTLSRQLLLTANRSGKTAIAGTLTDRNDAKFPYQVSGAGVFNPCGDSEFTLSTPATFTIRPGFSEIDFEIPAAAVRNPNWNKVTNSSRTDPIEAPTTDILDRFDRIRFTLTTSDRNHPEIKAYYEKN